MERQIPGHRNLHAIGVVLVLTALGVLYLWPPPVDQIRSVRAAILLLTAETVFYMLALLLYFRRIDVAQALAAGMSLVVLRACTCLLGASLGLVWREISGSARVADVWLALWLGDVPFACLQILLLVLLVIPYFAIYLPSITGEGAGGFDLTSGRTAPGGRRGVGGIVQFDNYDGLSDFLGRTPHLLGFALASSEGLLVINDGRRLPFPLEMAMPRLQLAMAEMQRQQNRCGLLTTEFWQFSPTYQLVYVPLEGGFYLAVFYRPDAPFGEVAGRLHVIRRTVEAFLKDRHSLLARNEREAA